MQIKFDQKDVSHSHAELSSLHKFYLSILDLVSRHKLQLRADSLLYWHLWKPSASKIRNKIQRRQLIRETFGRLTNEI